jgi:carboxyl-terminal processing protease
MKSQVKFGLLVIVVFIIALSMGLSGGIILDRRLGNNVTSASNNGINSNLDLNLISQALTLIKQDYVDQSVVTDTNLTYGAISGMVDALGDTGHSRFLTPQEVKQENDFTAGKFEGIGAEVTQQNGNVVIVYPIAGSPAQEAGLEPGDIITGVNGKDVTGQSLSDVVNQILGPAGTQVTVAILRPSTGQTLTFTITRAQITLQNVSWKQIPGTTIADLQITSFASGVTKDLQTAITQIQQQHMTGIILDLRNNPGGLLNEAISTASQFLSSGYVLQEKNVSGQIQKVAVEKGGVATNIPIIVLINQGTASAAEIVAGALQDNGRAQLVGETTFGTGTILNEFSLSDGSAILLATQEWLTPKSNTIWHKGITPNIPVTIAASAIPITPDTLSSMSAAQVQSSSDNQFLEALKVITQSNQQPTGNPTVTPTP